MVTAPVRRLGFEELWQALSAYAEAFTYAAGVWVPGPWALIGALVLPPSAVLCLRFFPNRFARLRTIFAPFAGGFAGGYFEAMSLRAGSCTDLTGLLCIISAPPEELALIILASMLSVVFVYLSLPGRKIPHRFYRPSDEGEAPEYEVEAPELD